MSTWLRRRFDDAWRLKLRRELVTKPAAVSHQEFDRIFESVKNWGKWGPDDQIGTMNYITPEQVRAAASLVKTGRRVTMGLPINKVAGPDNPHQAVHFITQAHDIDLGA